MINNKFSDLLNNFPHLALALLKILIPILAVIFVLSLIVLATEMICPTEILNILFNVGEDYEHSKRYLAMEKFINTIKDFIYYLIDQIINFFKYMLHYLMPNHNFRNFKRPDKCLAP